MDNWCHLTACSGRLSPTLNCFHCWDFDRLSFSDHNCTASTRYLHVDILIYKLRSRFCWACGRCSTACSVDSSSRSAWCVLLAKNSYWIDRSSAVRLKRTKTTRAMMIFVCILCLVILLQFQPDSMIWRVFHSRFCCQACYGSLRLFSILIRRANSILKD